MTDVHERHAGEPVVPILALRHRWLDLLRALAGIDVTASDLIANFRPVSIDGNQVILATNNMALFETLEGDHRKCRIVADAFEQVFGVRVFIDPAYSGPGEPLLIIENYAAGTLTVSLYGLQAKWTDTLRQLAKMHPAAADVMANFRPANIDGNMVFLHTSNSRFFGMLREDPRKQGMVELALSRVHGVRLYIRVLFRPDPQSAPEPPFEPERTAVSMMDTDFGEFAPPKPPRSITITEDGSYTLFGDWSATDLQKLLNRTNRLLSRVAMNQPVAGVKVGHPGDPDYIPF